MVSEPPAKLTSLEKLGTLMWEKTPRPQSLTVHLPALGAAAKWQALKYSKKDEDWSQSRKKSEGET